MTTENKEDKTHDKKTETMHAKPNKKKIGIANMFDGNEIKEYFNTFFILIGGVEFVILVAHFIGSIGPDKAPFPWKQYFFVSFIAPVVMIVVVGLVVVGFNFYIFGDERNKKAVEASPFVSTKGKRFIHSFKYLLDITRQIPVMAGFFFLCFGSLFLYKLDSIMLIAGHIGEKTAFYVFICLASLVGCALIFLLFWLFYKFRLHKFELKSRFEFKQKVMETAGLIILDNNVVIDKEGKVVANANLPELIDKQNDNFSDKKLLPDISSKFDFDK